MGKELEKISSKELKFTKRIFRDSAYIKVELIRMVHSEAHDRELETIVAHEEFYISDNGKAEQFFKEAHEWADKQMELVAKYSVDETYELKSRESE